MNGVPSPLIRLSEGLKSNHTKTFTETIKILKDLNQSNAQVVQNVISSANNKHKSERQIEDQIEDGKQYEMQDELQDEMKTTKMIKLATCFEYINNQMEDKTEADIQERVERNVKYQVMTEEPGYVLQDTRNIKIPKVQSSHKWRKSKNELMYERKKEEKKKLQQERQEEKEKREKEEKRHHKENKKHKKHKHHKTKRNHSDGEDYIRDKKHSKIEKPNNQKQQSEDNRNEAN